METAIPALIIIALLLVASVTMAGQILASHGAAAESWQTMASRESERSRTRISILDAYAPSDAQVTVVVSNDGQTKLADFARWDVVLRSGNVARWYPYEADGTTTDTWTKSIDEILEVGILNPGEEMTITLTRSKALATSNLVTVATPNGIVATKVFTR